MSDESKNSGSLPSVPITLRDWFAGQALGAILSSTIAIALDASKQSESFDAPSLINVEKWARQAYAMADAMLDARKAGET